MLAIITGANLFTEPYLLTNGGSPNGASTTPVLLIYQQAIQQHHPDRASAVPMVPLYVATVRNFGLADSYRGMVLPFAIHATAVLIFRAHFLQQAKDLFN